MTTVNLTKPVPSAPTGLTFVSGVNSAVISWTASSTATDKFQIYSNTANDSSTATLVTTVDTNSYTVNGLTAGQTKYFWVKTINSVGQVSGFSAYVGPTTSLLGSTFNTLRLAVNGEWRGTDDGSFANRIFSVDQVQVNINYTPSGGGSANTGWVSFTTTPTQAANGAAAGTGWSNPNFALASDSQTTDASVQTPGVTWSLLCLLGDAGVPSTATVTGIQARVTGLVTGGTTVVSEFKMILQIVSGTSTTISSRLGLSKEFTYTTKATPATITVGGTSDVWSLATSGTGVPAAPSVGVSTGAPTTAGAGTTTNALTFNNSGTGASSGTTFNGGTAQTISYNTVGAPSTTGTNASGTWGIAISGNAGSATLATNATKADQTNTTEDTTTAVAVYPTWVTANTGYLPQKTTSTKLSFVPSTGVLSSTSFAGAGTGLTGTATTLSIGGTAALATNVDILDETAVATVHYPVLSVNNTGSSRPKTSSTKLSYVPSTGVLSATSFTGAGTGLTGTAGALSIGGVAATASATTNAVTFNNGGAGAASGTTFNGSAAQTISYNTVGATAANALNRYALLMRSSASITAAQAAGSYTFGSGNPAVLSGAGSLYPIDVMYIDPADFPTINGITTKLRVKAIVNCNDVAPGSNFTFGLYPVTRPATSGGAGVAIYTMGTVVTGSAPTTLTAPAADSQSTVVGSDFAMPAAGFYVLGMVTSATIATSAHVHITCVLQLRNA